MISQHEKQLLQLFDGVLHGTPIPHICGEEWEPLYKEMKDQCVAILPSDYMDEFPLNPEQAEVYWGSVGKAIQYFYNILLEQSDAVSILQDAAIPVAVLKGAAAAMNYPHSEYRSMGDIDLIVPQEQFADAYHALIDHGYKVEWDNTLQVYHRHIGFTGTSGIEIELHHHFSSSLTKEHKSYYFLIGLVIAAVGTALTPFIPKLISGEVPADINVYILYLLNLSATIASYWLFAYKNSIFQAQSQLFEED